MAQKTWTLTDVHAGEYLVDFDSGDLGDVSPAAKGCTVTKKRHQGGLSDGVDSVRVSNGKFDYVVLPTRGMNIWRAWAGDFEIGWKSPVRGPVHPSFVDLGEPSGLGWLDGFDELLVRCGWESNGAPDFDKNGKLTYPLHGRIGNRPAQKVEVTVDGDSGEITVTGVVEETRFHFTKLRMTTHIKTKPGESGLRIHDVIENFSESEAGVQMLYHTNFGDPLLDAGARVIAPIKTLVPRNSRAAEGVTSWDSYEAPQPGFEEQVYFMELLADDDGKTHTMLKNAHGTYAASLRFDKKQLPCFTVWKNTTSLADGYVTGIEPGTNFPNPRTYESEYQRVLKLAAGESKSFDLQMIIHTDAKSVETAEQEIAALQAKAEPRICEQPQKGWCAP